MKTVNEYIAELKAEKDPDRRQRLKTLIAVNVGDQEALREIFGLDTESIADFYGDTVMPSPSTDDAISAFLSNYGSRQAQPLEEELQIVPAVDYFTLADTQRAGSTEKPEDSEKTRLPEGVAQADSEVSESEAYTDSADLEETEDTDKSEAGNSANQPSLTLSFVGILIKNRNYEKALEILSDLNLNNSEKSIYFADQIRFIKKLIANSKS